MSRTPSDRSLRDASPHEGALQDLGSFIEALADGVAVVDANGRQVWVNDRFCEMVGWSRDELVGAVPPHCYWPPEHLDGIERALGETLTGKPREFELVFVRKSGERFPVSVYPARAELGGEEVFVATVKDITELRARDRQYESTKDFLRTMLSSGDFASWERNLLDGTSEVSDTYFTLLGYEPNAWEASYDEWARRVHPDDIGDADRSMQGLITDQSRLYDAEFRMLDANGEWRWMLARGYVTERTEEGAPARITGTMQDIHRLKTQEIKLRQFQQMDMLGQLAGGIAHDLRNLMFIIGSSLEAARGAPPEEQAKYLDRIEDAVELAENLTESMLLRVGNEAQVAAAEALDVQSFLAATRDLLGSTLPENVRLGIDPFDEPSPIKVGRVALENAILNLVVNARDAIAARPEGGEIRIGTRIENVGRADAERLHVAPGPYVILSVTDDGAGMGPDVLERATEPLFSTKGAGKGTGLGLSMAKKVAGEAHGFLRIESEEGSGTTVDMAFPLSVELPEAKDAVTDPEVDELGGTETVLVVDDQEEVVDVVAAYLSRLGYEVVPAGNPRQALAHVRERSVDMLLTDVVMPFTLDGIDLAREVRELRPDMPILFMTGFLDQEQRISTEAFGSVIRKPFRIRELGRAVRVAIEGPAARA